MKIKKILILSFFIVTASYETLANSKKWVGSYHVTKVVVEPGAPGYSIFTDSDFSECDQKGKFYVKAEENESDKIYAMALTAYTAKKRVAFHIDLETGCVFGGKIAKGMWIAD